MAPNTRRPDDATQLEHVRKELWKINQDSPLLLALDHSGCASLVDIFAMSEDDIAALRCEEEVSGNKNEHQLTPGALTKICMLTAFSRFKADEGQVVKDWTKVLRPELEDCVHEHHFRAAGSVSPKTRTEEQIECDFDKSIKRDASLFLALKSFTDWSAHWISFKMQMKSQQHDNVLNTNCKPPTAASKQLFVKHCNALLAMFDAKLKDDKAREILHKRRDLVDDGRFLRILRLGRVLHTDARLDCVGRRDLKVDFEDLLLLVLDALEFVVWADHLDGVDLLNL